MKKYDLQMFAAETNTITTTDLAPAISVDFVSRIHTSLQALREVLGITDMIAMNAGTQIKMYKMVRENIPAQVGEGENIPLTKITRKLAGTIEMDLDKYRKNTTAETIQQSGYEMAINKTDEKLVSEIRKDIKKAFYTVLKTGTGTSTGEGLQTALAAAWAELQKLFEDEDVTPVFFIHPDDLAGYLGSAQVTLQTAFGLSYISNFLGLGTVIVSPQLDPGKLIATAKENLCGAYVPAGTADVARAFNLTTDATGMIGMTHSPVTSNATIDTLIMSCVKFYPERVDGVVVSTITPPAA